MILNLMSSLTKFCVDQAALAQTAGFTSGMSFVNFDAHAEIPELPNTDIIALFAVGIAADGKFHEVSASIGVSTWQDPNLFRHYAICDQLYRALQPNQKIDLYNVGTATKNGWIVIEDGTTMYPVGRAEIRTIQFIQFTGMTDPLSTQM